MEANLFIVFVVIVIVIIILSQVFSAKARIKRKLKRAELKKMAHFRSGDVAKIVGKVEIVGEPLVAPLSGRKCALYSILVQERVSSGYYKKENHPKESQGAL